MSTSYAYAARSEDTRVLVPRANIIERVAHVAMLVNDGIVTGPEIAEHYGMVRQMGSYYTDAAVQLGLINYVRDGSKFFYLTPAGKEFVNAEGMGKIAVLRKLVHANRWVKFYLDHNKNVDALINHIHYDAGLSVSESEKRADTIIRWFMDVSAMSAPVNFAAVAMPTTTRGSSSARTPGAHRGRPAGTRTSMNLRPTIKEVKEEVLDLCQEHFMVKSISGVCSMCD